MEKLSKESTDIFLSIISQLNADGYVKLDNGGGFMPLSVERIEVSHNDTEEIQKISFAHYGKQNGDLMADPEMLFLYFPAKSEVFPYYYKNDYVAYERASILFDGNGKPNPCYTRQQAEHVEFAEMWLNNIKEQQELAV